jgi:hypothetical protein
MKYPIESLELNFDVEINSYTKFLYIWKTGEQYLPRKKMLCYTFDLDYDGELTTTDIEKIQEYFGPYFDEEDVNRLKEDSKKIRVGLFLAMTNSPKCPYKIIGVSERFVQGDLMTTYHFMIKHNILTNTSPIKL